MNKIKEIFAVAANKMAHEAQEEAWEDYKKKVRDRMKEVISEGKFECFINQLACPSGRWKETMEWLRDLGYVVSWQCGNTMARVKWDDSSIAKLNRDDASLYRALRAQEVREEKDLLKQKEEPDSFIWIFDPHPYDYICSCFNEHSEYRTKYCPNCGAKMIID